MFYSELGQALTESLNMKDGRVRSKKLNESSNKSLKEDLYSTPTSEFIDVLSELPKDNIIIFLTKWLTQDTIEAMLEDIKKDYDLDYFEEIEK